MSKITLAITGTIGSGKSSVANYIRSKGYYVFDCDKVNSNLLNKGNLGYNKLLNIFPEVFDGEQINKSKLASIVFIDETKRKQLQEIMHPLIYEEMLNEMASHDTFIAEVPLLFESNWDKYFDHNLLVVSNEENIKKRLLKRGLSIEEINIRKSSQLTSSDKLKRAEEIIYNNSDLPTLYKEVDKWLEKYVR